MHSEECFLFLKLNFCRFHGKQFSGGPNMEVVAKYDLLKLLSWTVLVLSQSLCLKTYFVFWFFVFLELCLMFSINNSSLWKQPFIRNGEYVNVHYFFSHTIGSGWTSWSPTKSKDKRKLLHFSAFSNFIGLGIKKLYHCSCFLWSNTFCLFKAPDLIWPLPRRWNSQIVAISCIYQLHWTGNKKAPLL